MSLSLLFVIHTILCYRVSRFIIEDELIDGWRTRIKMLLASPDGGLESGQRFRDNPREFVKDKVWSLLQCPYCVSIWVAAGIVAVHLIWLDGLPLPVWWWVALSGGSLIVWKYVED